MRHLPKAIESVVASVDLNGYGAGVGLCHAPIALHDDELGPDFVVDLVPFIQHFLDVILFQREKTELLLERLGYIRERAGSGGNETHYKRK